MSRAVAVTILAVWLCSVAYAQSGEAKPEFEVASVKPSARDGRGAIKVDRGGPDSGDPGRVTYSFSSIRDLMVDAYGVKRYQISGGPNWLDSERFDIVAKIPAGATKEQVRVMPQNLLAERFKLALHRESKELPIYALVVGAKGARLKDATAIDTPVSEPKEVGGRSASPQMPLQLGLSKDKAKLAPDGCPDVPPMARGAGNFTMITPDGACMISYGQSMDFLATQLSNRLDRPVLDQTGVKGKYDWRLRYDPASMPNGGGGGAIQTKDGAGPRLAGGDPADRTAANGGNAPSLFNALQAQLGLRLEARKAMVDVLVIDHVEKTPTEN